MISKTHTKSGWIIDRHEKVLEKVEEDKPVKKKKKGETYGDNSY